MIYKMKVRENINRKKNKAVGLHHIHNHNTKTIELYSDAMTRVRVGSAYSEKFEVKVSVH